MNFVNSTKKKEEERKKKVGYKVASNERRLKICTYIATISFLKQDEMSAVFYKDVIKNTHTCHE